MSRKRENGRRSIRLGGYEYSRPGAYFVTACSVRRGHLFGRVSDGVMVENGNASIVRECGLGLPDHYPHIALDAFVLMPDHIHGIIVLGHGDVAGLGFAADRASWAGLKPAPTTGGGAYVDGGVRHGLSEIVRALKTYSARRINVVRGTPGAAVWQRGYYDRIIRDEHELNHARTYITNNPRNWLTDREHTNPPPPPHHP